MMDNRIFNVNGKGDEMLLRAIKLVFEQSGANTTAKAWSVTKKRGLILHWWYDKSETVQGNELFKTETYTKHPFPANMTAEQCLPFISAWLQSDEAKKTETVDDDANADHDGHNGPGWRVFCEGWGHVNSCSDAICAIKPVYLWYGK